MNKENETDILSKLKDHCEKYVARRINPEGVDGEWLHYIGEDAVQFIYGEDIFDKLSAFDLSKSLTIKALGVLARICADSPVCIASTSVEIDTLKLSKLVNFEPKKGEYTPTKLGKFVMEAIKCASNINEFLVPKDISQIAAHKLQYKEDKRDHCPYRKDEYSISVGSMECRVCGLNIGYGKDRDEISFILCEGK